MPELEEGDVLVQGKFHALMWVGGEKPIVHNANKGQFHGVLRQSLKGALVGSNEPHAFFDMWSPTTYAVYRCSEKSTASDAAAFAVGWSTESGSEAADLALRERAGRLKTPYSDDRMVYAEYDAKAAEREWSVPAMYRALKAYARFEEALTPKKGSSCSQFITYCFQAASVKRLVGDLAIPKQTLDLLRQGGGYLKLSDPSDKRYSKNIIEVAERAAEVFQDQALPMVVTNAKVVYVGSLLERLNAAGSGFANVGSLVPNSALTAARILSPPDAAADWPTARQRVGF